MKVVATIASAMITLIVFGQAAMNWGAPHLAIILWCLSLVAIGLLFYRVRIRSRLCYGIFELLVAMIASYFVLLNLYSHAEAFTFELIASRMMILFAAVYVIVRALDNIGQDLSRNWRFTKAWKALFGR